MPPPATAAPPWPSMPAAARSCCANWAWHRVPRPRPWPRASAPGWAWPARRWRPRRPAAAAGARPAGHRRHNRCRRRGLAGRAAADRPRRRLADPARRLAGPAAGGDRGRGRRRQDPPGAGLRRQPRRLRAGAMPAQRCRRALCLVHPAAARAGRAIAAAGRPARLGAAGAGPCAAGTGRRGAAHRLGRGTAPLLRGLRRRLAAADQPAASTPWCWTTGTWPTTPAAH